MNLSEAINSTDTIIFIGSGVSAWSGLPSWGRMIEELADYLDKHGIDSNLVRNEANNGDLLQAASYGFDKITISQQGDFIRQSCKYGTARPSSLHHLIATMGPRCFITTNYDNLIEESLRRWRSNIFFRPPITNKDFIGMPEIVQARATDFIFKPHGDAADTDSIVLTREQYRLLLPGGERQAALESLKLLLVSRPVIYIGFGLRDPDFLYLKDVLLNIYKGGTRDHFALMADVTQDHVDYWRRSYGIHLISYQTSLNKDGTKNHEAILNILEDSSKFGRDKNIAENEPKPTDPEIILSLARFAAGLSQIRKPVTEFKIHVHRSEIISSDLLFQRQTFDGATVEEFLENFKKASVLIGMPGAGKSYALRKSSVQLAIKLQKSCLQSEWIPSDTIVPIFADLKLYQGNLQSLLSTSLPTDIDLLFLLKHFRVKIYLDSFNEVPRKHIESGEFKKDLLNFIDLIDGAALIIGSRTMDGLESLGFEKYELDSIASSTVIEELQRINISLKGRFQSEMLSLLQRPFYFRYILDREVELPQDPHPREFYRLFLKGVAHKISTKLRCTIELTKILRPAAYQSLNSGEEAFPFSMLIRAIEANLPHENSHSINPIEIANNLISQSILIPYSGERVAFVHQSITEYLASLELAERYSSTPDLLREKISLRRWDQALFLTLGHLKPPEDQRFLRVILDVDPGLAISSVKFLEKDRDKVVGDLLNELIKRESHKDRYDFVLQHTIEKNLPVNSTHIHQLEQFVESNHSLMSSAIYLIIKILGERAKSEYLHFLLSKKENYNLCNNTIAPLLSKFAKEDDLQLISRWASELEEELHSQYDENNFHGFTGGSAIFAESLPIISMKINFMPSSPEQLAKSPIKMEILRRFIQRNRSTESLQCALELLLMGDKKIPYTIYSILAYAKAENNLNVECLDENHVNAILSLYFKQIGEENSWTFDAIYQICQHRPDFRKLIENKSNELPPLLKAEMHFCIHEDPIHAFNGLGKLLDYTNFDLENEKIPNIAHWELDWNGKEDLFSSLLQLKNRRLCKSILGSGVPVHIKGLGKIEIHDPVDWLDWIDECLQYHDFWLVSLISSFLGQHSTEDFTHTLIGEVNNTNSKHRHLLISRILYHFKSVNTDHLSNETCIFAIKAMLNQGSHSSHGSFLGAASTESFVIERLKPLLLQVTGKQKDHLQLVLKEAGRRHGRRYF